MERIKLPNLPISKEDKRSLKKKYVEILKAEEQVDKKMIDQSINNYLLKEVDYKNKICLDLGCNIGAFTQIALDSEAKKVYSVECDKRNFEKISKTFENESQVELIFGAVSGLEEEKIKIYKSSSGNKHCSTSIISKMRFGEYDEVPNVNFKYLINKINPDIIKIDIESAEYTFIEDLLDYFPETLFIEFHGKKEKMEKTIELFKSKYKNYKVEPLIIYVNQICGYDCFFKK